MAGTSTRRVVLGSAALLVVATVLAAALVWRVDGGRWYDVRTASMGTAAPVGTLLLTRPTAISDIEVGDLITFRAPGSGAVYSHRVVTRTADGLTTRGDVNPVPDAWTLHQGDLVGKVVHTVPGAGWLLRGLPLLMLCIAITWGLSFLVGRDRRDSVRVLGAAMSLGVIGLVLRPWVGLERLGSSEADKGVVLRVISTGLMPIRASAANGGGDSAHLVNGGVGDIHVPHADPRGAYELGAALSLSWGWWVALAAVTLAPLAWCLIWGLSPVEEPLDESEHGDDRDPDQDRRPGGDHRLVVA